MDGVFLFKLALSFLIGGIWVISSTIAADRLGPKIGGLIAGLPSTVMFGLFFLAWTQSASAGAAATTVTPMAAGFTCLFILTYCLLVNRSFWGALVGALTLWTTLAFGIIQFHFQSFPLSLVGYILLFCFSLYLLEYKLTIRSIKGKKVTYTPKHILIRGLISGTIVALAVYCGKIAGPTIGGMFSMFPAMFTSTILITYFTQGAQFSAATMKSTMVSAITTVVYAIMVRYTYIPMGIIFGTLISIIVSFACGYFIYRFAITKLK
jgi:hypothetical protein